jgi:molybdopterin converting factor small subunit
MAVIRLSGQLQALAGGPLHTVEGATVRDALITLEARNPQIGGWILDERRMIRRHINVFVNGERGGEDTPVRHEAQIHVLPAITGGLR